MKEIIILIIIIIKNNNKPGFVHLITRETKLKTRNGMEWNEEKTK